MDFVTVGDFDTASGQHDRRGTVFFRGQFYRITHQVLFQAPAGDHEVDVYAGEHSGDVIRALRINFCHTTRHILTALFENMHHIKR